MLIRKYIDQFINNIQYAFIEQDCKNVEKESARKYIDIIINNDQYTIVELDSKNIEKGAALATLKKIEDVIYGGLKYAGGVGDGQNTLSPEEALGKLREKAKYILDGYTAKTSGISSIRKFFGKVDNQISIVETAYNHIENLISPPSVLNLSNELIQYIFSFLDTTSLNNIGPMNRHANDNAMQSYMQRACQYGYKGHNLQEAKQYLHILFQAIDKLIEDGYIPEKYVIRVSAGIDSEATLRKIKCLSSKKALDLKGALDRALLRYAKEGNHMPLEVLINLGVDVETKDEEGQTPLMWACKMEHAEILELLINAGANVNAKNKLGQTPLMLALANAKSKELLKIKNFLATALQNNTVIWARNALFYALHHPSPELLNILLKNGALTNETDNLGNTVLHSAADRDLPEIAQLFLRFGASTTIVNNRGNLPIDCTLSQTTKKILQ